VQDTIAFFTDHGLPVMVEAGQRVFSQTEKASDVVQTLLAYMQQGKVKIQTKAEVRNIIGEQGQIKGVVVGKETLIAKSYILATGGKSHPETGSTGDGFQWLINLGHTIQTPTPTIVPLAVSDAWVKSLSGISLDNVKITFFVNKKKQLTLKGRILCTHFGLSGPLILNAAGKVGDMLRIGAVTAAIDVFPQFDLGSLDHHIIETLNQNKNKTFVNVFRRLVPVGTYAALLALLPVAMLKKKVHSMSKEERKTLGHLLKTLPVTIIGLMGFEWAVVTDGGLPVSEVEGKTLRSRKYANLFVTGDLLHISRPSGGYSLQLCWTTGYVAGSNA
jgi:predicted Rossmann fold flavoprotein